MRNGAGDDFDEFVRGRSLALLRVAFLLTGDRHDAEDLVQDVLGQVYVRWKRIHLNPEAYARRALVNRAIDRWRRRGRTPESPLGEHDQTGPDRTEDVVVRTTVVAALRELPVRQRAAVVLRFLEDLSVVEVARALDCSEGTVMSHTARGLSKLRAALADSGLVTTVPPAAQGGSHDPR